MLRSKKTLGPVANRLLAALPGKEYQRLRPHLEEGALAFGEILYEPARSSGASMLGVRREGVTSAARALQQGNLISRLLEGACAVAAVESFAPNFPSIHWENWFIGDIGIFNQQCSAPLNGGTHYRWL